MENIDKLLENLSWNKHEQIQNKAIQELFSINDEYIHKLLQPSDKSCWENAARVISSIEYPRIISLLPGMLEWLQDMNWPGAWIIFEKLKDINTKILTPYLKDSFNKAIEVKDDLWIEALELLVNDIIKEQDINEDTDDILRLVDRQL